MGVIIRVWVILYFFLSSLYVSLFFSFFFATVATWIGLEKAKYCNSLEITFPFPQPFPPLVTEKQRLLKSYSWYFGPQRNLRDNEGLTSLFSTCTLGWHGCTVWCMSPTCGSYIGKQRHFASQKACVGAQRVVFVLRQRPVYGNCFWREVMFWLVLYFLLKDIVATVTTIV